MLELFDLLERRRRAGAALLLVMHDCNLAAQYATRLLGLREGRVLFDGPVRRCFTAENLRALYAVDLHIVPHPRNGLPQALPCGLVALNTGRTLRMKPDLCRLRQRIAVWGFRPGLWLGLCLCLFCCSVLPARALELVDSRGVTLRLERPAQRIIALYGAFNEILLALDAARPSWPARRPMRPSPACKTCLPWVRTCVPMRSWWRPAA